MVVTISHDITDAKRAEAIQKCFEEDLRNQVNERTADLERANQLLRQEVAARQQSEAQARTLTAVAARLNATLDLEILLKTIVEELVKTLPYRLCEVMLYDEESDMLELRAAAGDYTEAAFGSASLPGALYRRYLEAAGPLIILDDLSTLGDALQWPLVEEINVRTLINIALQHDEQLIGCLNVISLEIIRLPNQDELNLIEGLANLATTALVNARLYQQTQDSRARLQALSRQLIQAQETERREIAIEMHDEIGQTITYLIRLFDMSIKNVTASGKYSKEMDTQVQNARKLVNDLLQEVRELSTRLRPPMLDDLGLLPALYNHIERVSKQTSIEVEFKHTLPEVRFAPEVETTAFRIIQQALANVVRHAKTDQVSVSLWSYGDTLQLQVEDQGVGFDSQSVMATKTTGGLPFLREQIALIGGKLEINSAPGEGASLTAEIPLQPLT